MTKTYNLFPYAIDALRGGADGDFHATKNGTTVNLRIDDIETGAGVTYETFETVFLTKTSIPTALFPSREVVQNFVVTTDWDDDANAQLVISPTGDIGIVALTRDFQLIYPNDAYLKAPIEIEYETPFETGLLANSDRRVRFTSNNVSYEIEC